MAIYKLKDLCIEKPIYGAPLGALEIGKYKYFRQTDIKFGFPTKFVNKTCGKIMKNNDFFISRAGSIEAYLHNSNEEWVYAGYLVKYPLNIKIIFPKYLFYYFKSSLGVNEIRSNINTGSTMPKLNPPIALNLRVICPSLKEQQKIIDIIEPHKHLFEKYHNCIRIDSFENTKKDLQKIIDIIEPINYLKNNIKSIENKTNFLVKNQSFKSFNKMYEFVKFNKGSIVKSTEFIYKNDQSNLIPFIDIKSLTGIVNKYLDNHKYKSNTQIGDVLLSLDGAPGRVSITNNGYNGYAYKINSNKISNAIIWASLINKINQKIIQKHSYGTTILHANTSKQLLLILNFKNVELIKILYQIKLLIFKIQQLIKNIYNLMLQLLIK